MKIEMHKQIPAENVSLVINHIGFARKLARQFFLERQNLGLDYEDLEGAALLGLCDAASRYTKDRGLGFQTFCFFRVRGAMFDLLRNGGGIPRRHFRRMIGRESEEEVEQQKQGKPQLPYTFARNTTELAALASVIEDVGIRLHFNEDRELTDISYAEDLSPEDAAAVHNGHRYMEGLLARLPERERKIIELKYFAGRSFDDIRRQFGAVSKSWVSRMHGRALTRLRTLIASDDAACAAKAPGEWSVE